MDIPIYLLLAYAIFWVLTFVLVIAMWVRQRRLEQEIAALEAQVSEQAERIESDPLQLA